MKVTTNKEHTLVRVCAGLYQLFVGDEKWTIIRRDANEQAEGYQKITTWTAQTTVRWTEVSIDPTRTLHEAISACLR